MAHFAESVPVTAVTRRKGTLCCMNCGSGQYEITRHRRKCWNCGSRRFQRRGGRVEVSRVRVKQSLRNPWPLKTRTVNAGDPFGPFAGNFKLALVD